MIAPDSMNLIDNKEHFDIIKSVQVSKENFWFDFETKQRQNSSVERWGSYENYEGFMRLNETGVFLWKHMQEDCTEDALVQAIVEEYDTTEACARKDVRAFIKQLQEQDLLL